MLKLNEKEIYLRIRAEQIKERQDRENGHLMLSPYPLEKAREIAEVQLETDLEAGKLRISLDDLLLLSDEVCVSIVEQETCRRAQKLLAA